MRLPHRLAVLVAAFAAVALFAQAPDSTRANVVAAEQSARAVEADRQVADEIARRFDGDRAKFLAYLRAKGKTVTQYRLEMSEQIHLRLLELRRREGDSDATLDQESQAILARLRSGETFSDLVVAYGRGMRQAQGGDLGWIRRTDLQPAFSAVAFALKKGEASAPIVLPEGAFILFVEDRR